MGNDAVGYNDAASGVTAPLANPGINTRDAAGETYISIERLSGSRFSGVLIGDAGNNTLRGNAGADQLDGQDGFDYVRAKAAVRFASVVGGVPLTADHFVIVQVDGAVSSSSLAAKEEAQNRCASPPRDIFPQKDVSRVSWRGTEIKL